MKKQLNNCLGSLMVAWCLYGAAGASAATIQVTANISGTATWRSTNTYVLNGFIYVLDGAVLNIEPGTIIKGKPGQDANTSCLIVTRGAKIFAEGTRTKPIIFTAEADDVFDPEDLALYQRGLWGGVVLLGKAVLNTTVDATGNAANPKYEVFEGLADSVVSGQNVNRFGGNDDNDSSGIMRYVSIRHAGVVFQPNKELNGLSMGAVGRGTVLEYIESYATADDGFEFFGGTVNTKYLVSAFNDDDAFDIDMGYRGKNQFWFAIQEPGRKDSGGEWNGEPSGVAANAAPIANFQVYNGTWIGAGSTSSGNRALNIREYAAPKVYNSIFTDFGGAGILLDAKSETHLTSGLLDIRDNIWFQFASPLAESAAAGPIFSDVSRSNEVVNPMLRSIGRTNNFRLDPRPLVGSPATTSPRTAPDDGFYTPVAYKGAFDTNDLWLCTWTFLSEAGVIPERGANTIQVTANISGNANWYRTNEYVLNGFIYVLAGATLNIEAGTVIKGRPGQDANTSCLIVTRGAKIFARGTHNNPIIFTAEADDILDPEDLGLYQRGLWGGVVLLGNAVLNTTVDATGNAANPKYEVFEGLADSTINGQNVNRFGGNNDNDSSGEMRYVSIRHSGVVFQPNKELNGLSLGAVGRGTVLENIESYAVADDGFEFFGGTVNTKYLVSAFNDDDAFDIDMGYRGKNQFWFAIQEPGRKDSGGEWNGEPSGVAANAPPIANFEVYNGTWIGAGSTSSGNRALNIREYAAPKVYNSIFTDFGGAGILLDAKSETHLTSGLLDIRDNIWFQFASALAESAAAGPIFSDVNRSNIVVDPMLRSISRTNHPAFRLDPRPTNGSPALASSRTAPNDGHYTPVAYKGAFQTNNWATDWTAIGELCVLSASGARVPRTGIPPLPTCQPVSLTLLSSGGNITLEFGSTAGLSYQIESATDVAGPWGNEGSALSGTGGTLSYNTTTGGPQKFFRVRCLGN